MRVAYVFDRYPTLGQGQVIDEIVQLESRGMEVVILASMDPREVLRDPIVDRVRAPVQYIRSGRAAIARLFAAHTQLFTSYPDVYCRAVSQPIRDASLRREARLYLEAGGAARLVLDGGVDHLHAACGGFAATLALHTAMLSGLSFSFSASAADTLTTRRSAIARKAMHAAFITPPTITDETYLRRILPTACHSKMFVIYPSVDTARFHPRAHSGGTAPPSLISVGQLVADRGYPQLIDALALVRKRGVSFRAYIYGNGPLKDQLRARIKAMELDGYVSLRGECSQDELAEAYRQADVFALMPVNDDRQRRLPPLPLLEAMASGLAPVVASSSRIDEVVMHGTNSLVVHRPEPEEIAAALETALCNSSLRASLGAAARATIVRQFDDRTNARTRASLFSSRGAALAQATAI